jgi:hypothetical protein
MIWTTPTRGNTVGAKIKVLKQSTFTGEVVMDKVIAIGIDLAKNIVSVHGQNEQGKAVLKKSLKPAAMFELLATMEPSALGTSAWLPACAQHHNLHVSVAPPHAAHHKSGDSTHAPA